MCLVSNTLQWVTHVCASPMVCRYSWCILRLVVSIDFPPYECEQAFMDHDDYGNMTTASVDMTSANVDMTSANVGNASMCAYGLWERFVAVNALHLSPQLVVLHIIASQVPPFLPTAII